MGNKRTYNLIESKSNTNLHMLIRSKVFATTPEAQRPRLYTPTVDSNSNLWRSTNWTSRGCRRAAGRAGARRGTRTAAAASAATPSPGAPPGTRPCDSTAWAGAARATRAGPGSASSCFKRWHVFETSNRPKLGRRAGSLLVHNLINFLITVRVLFSPENYCDVQKWWR